MKKLLLTVLMLFSFSGFAFCDSVNIAPKVSTAAVPVQIAMYGDSTMYGLIAPNGYPVQSPDNPPSQLGKMLAAAGYNATTTNNAVSGTTTADLLNGTGGFPRTWASEMALSTAQVIVVNEGANDAAGMYYGTETQAQFQSNWTAIIQIAQAAGKTIYMETPSPATYTPYAQVGDVALMELQVWSQQSVKPGFIDEFTAVTDYFPNWQAHEPGGLHPDNTLYSFKANIELLNLTPILGLTNP